MASILKRTQRVTSAKAFHTQIDAGKVYVGLGRTASWADDNVPPLPIDTLDSDEDFWTNLIGVAKVDLTDTTMCIPRVDWTSGFTYQLFDTASETAYEESYYAMNQFGYVYECTGVGGGSVSSEPTGTGPVIDTGDGYQWTYLYQLTVNDITDIVTNDWIPCYTGFEDKMGANVVMIRRLIPDAPTTGNKIGFLDI